MKRMILGILIHCHFLQADWIDRKAEGWFWYEDRKNVKKSEKEEIEICYQNIDFQTAKEEVEAARKELEERLAEAILRPTEENLFAYMQLQQKWINQSAAFSKEWTKALLNNPRLDSRVNDFPITQYGVQVQKHIIQEKRESFIRSLTENYALLFFYEGQNKVSQAFSFVVKEFSKKYEWQLAAISCDQSLIPGFENNQLNNGIIQKLGIEVFPSLYLLDPKEQIVIPIAFGLSSFDQIEANIELQKGHAQ
jgi:conjugal transfer pilus assembly protein TraF